jgi:hypothetical protein
MPKSKKESSNIDTPNKLEQLRGRATTRADSHAGARINRQVAFGILGDTFGFTDGMAGNDKREMLLGDV